MLTERASGTRLAYHGEMGADLCSSVGSVSGSGLPGTAGTAHPEATVFAPGVVADPPPPIDERVRLVEQRVAAPH